MAVAVILAAGTGSRLWPLTAKTPKALVRVCGKPLAEHAIEGIAPLFSKIVLVVSPKDKPGFEKHFSKKPYAGKLSYAVQEKPAGTAHAVLAAAKQVGKNDFLVLNGDCFFSKDFYGELAKKLMERKPFIVAKRAQNASAFGLLKVKSGKLAGIGEKSSSASGLVNTGCYYAGSEMLAFLEKVVKSPRGELEATDALTAYGQKHAIEVMEHAGFWTDVGHFWNYLDASRHFLEHSMEGHVEGTIEPGVTVKGKLFVGRGSVVKSGTYVEGPVYVGENCTIGPGAFLRPGTFLEGNNHVGKSEVKNSILLMGANAPHFNYVGDSVLCEDVNLGAGAKTANFRFDAGEIWAEVKGNKVATGRNKLGSCIGPGAKVGVNATINCGLLIGEGARVLPNAFLSKNLADGETSK